MSQGYFPKLHLFLKAYIPPLVWAIVIYLFSSQQVLPGFEVSSLDFVLKKSAHMFVYAVLYLLLYRGIQLTTQPRQKNIRSFAPFIICLMYAITDELHQSYVPGRTATIRDIGYDVLGMFTVILRMQSII